MKAFCLTKLKTDSTMLPTYLWDTTRRKLVTLGVLVRS